MNVTDFCKKHNINEDQFYGREKIEGGLDLGGLTSIPAGWNPTVGGDLYLSGLTSIPAGWNPTVGGYLYLPNLASIPASWNPTVGGGLNLSSLTNIPADFNPTVGGGLNLSSLTNIPADFNPTVGGGLYLKNETIPVNSSLPIITWQNGRYISIDGIFGECISVKGNAYKLKKVHKEETFYVVQDGNTYSHGNTLREAYLDLKFKQAKRDPDIYKTLTKESVLTHEEAIIFYRVITGSCQYGVNNFLERHKDKIKPEYSVEEILNLTKDEYGYKSVEKFLAKA